MKTLTEKREQALAWRKRDLEKHKGDTSKAGKKKTKQIKQEIHNLERKLKNE